MPIFLLLLAFTAALMAQNLNTFRGQVTDPSSASVPGAVVRIAPVGGKEQRKNTDASGNFEFRNLVAGKYTIRVEKPGFSMYQVDELQVSGATQFNIQLSLNAQAQVVDVQSEVQGVTTDPLQNAGALVLKEEDLASFSDDPDLLADELMALAGPGAGPNGGQLFIDGFSGGKLPPKSSIREVRVNSNPYSAEYDRIGFGRIEILTKPGTDRFRGDAHYNFSDSSLNSRNPFSPTRAPFRSQLWGGRLSGPLTAKKASFSIDIEGRNVNENAIINATILNTSLLPTPFQQTVVTPQRRFTITNRIDYAINDKNTLVGRYTFSPTSSDNQGVGQFSLLSRAYNSKDTDHTVQLTETAVLSTRAINETRFQYLHSNTEQLGNNALYALSVQDAFTGGGPQNGVSKTIDIHYELTNITTWVKGSHTIKFGGRARRSNQESTAPNNFGGSYTFAGGLAPVLDANNNPILNPDGSKRFEQTTSLERYRRTLLFQGLGYSPEQIRSLGGGASQFSINLGNPFAGVKQYDVGLFTAWDWRINTRATFSAGLRWEDQTNISNHNNIAPRIGLAYALDGGAKKVTKTVLRLGTGIFYDRIDDSLTLSAIRFNGVNQVSYTVRDPDYFPNIPSPEALAPSRNALTIRELYSGLRTPYLIQSSAGIERSLPRNTNLAVTYIFSRGVHLLRQRNINTPYFDGFRPYGNVGNIFLNEATGFSRQNQLMTNFRTRFSSRVNLFGYYSLNFARADTDGGGPANPYDLHGEYGPARQDIRHRFTLQGSIAAKWGISLSPNFTVNSGAPFNITTGRDTNGDTLFNERPAFATDLNGPDVVRTPWGNFNVNPGPHDRIIPRNYGRGPVNYSLNLRLAKTWAFGPESTTARPTRGGGGGGGGARGGGGRGGRGGGMGGMGGGMGMGPDGGGGSTTTRKYSLTFSASGRNILNTVNLATPNGNLTSPFFGISTSTANGGGFGGGGGGGAAANRRIDLSVRFSF
ncbi:TonB-dependent receptor [Bryobacter aggregatus]|uniref:TonB-dependent receptor n=1 Tax=Bryobacter aggregatus TaxID=360054 RepID=UPI0004E21BE0|nr:carboxypeptidase-like regulatory domain-containing protein [Bryobacter aggregatus]